MEFEGKVWKFGENMSTDLMMPHGHASVSDTSPEVGKMCMSPNRPGWSSQVKPGDIIIAGRNWGCGSARPAGTAFMILGVSIIVADSVSRLFFRNAVNLGMPIMICDGVSKAFDEGDRARVIMDTGAVYNLTKGTKLQGEALPADSPPMQILRAGGLMKIMEKLESARQN